MANKAAETRYAAITALMATFMTPTGTLIKEDTGSTRGRIILEIDCMRRLGRTERWHSALDRWVSMITDRKNPLDWALLQGSIYAGYGAL